MSEDVKNNEGRKLDDFYHFATRFDRSISFWKENPDLKYLTPYREFIEEVGEDVSANIMDAVWMVYDLKSASNSSGNRPREEVKEEVQKHFLKDKNFQWQKYTDIIESFQKDTTTKIEKQLMFWHEQLEGKHEYLKKLPWSVSAEEKSKLLKDNKQMFKDYLEVEAMAKKERKEKRYYSGVVKSLIEEKHGK